MNCFIESLYISPVKSLSLEKLNSTFIKKDIGLLNDRLFAFTRNIDIKDAKIFEKKPNKRKLNNFLSLKNTPVLNKYNFSFNDNKLYLRIINKIIFSISIKDTNDYSNLSEELIKLEPSIRGPIYLLMNSFHPFFDTMPKNSISLININSIKDLNKKLSINIEKERFRGNIYIDGLVPWDEFKFIGKKLKINNLVFRVERKIPRCSATNLKPNTDNVTINLPKELKRIYNHIYMGIYLTPLGDGRINIYDKVKFL